MSPESLHVLVVDDDAVNRGLARMLLEKNGYAVAEAEDGEQALDMLGHGERYDLMVLDLNMPKLDGREVLRRVRASTATADLPIVLLSGSDMADTATTLMEQGAQGYISKPIDPLRFVARIKATLGPNIRE